MIKFACPGCGRNLNVPDNASGKTGRCPNCKASVVVPAAAESVLEFVADAPRHASPRATEAPKPSPAPPAAGGSNSLGIASLVLGALAFSICWIPFLGVFGLPLSGLGAILGLVGFVAALRRAGRGIGFPIAGTAVSALALIVCVAITTAFSRAVVETGKSINETREKAQATNQTVVGAKPPDAAAAANPPAMPVPPNPKVQEQEQENWASAKQAVQQGDVRIRVTKVAVQKIPLKNLGRSTESTDDLLSVHLQVANTSQTKKVNYLTWRGKDFSLERDWAAMTDNFDNTLKRIGFGFGTEVEGAVESTESIYPGKSVDDILVFEAPIDATEYLRLELPAKNFGGTGNIRLQIPTNMIER
jgi:hypothetical protein